MAKAIPLQLSSEKPSLAVVNLLLFLGTCEIIVQLKIVVKLSSCLTYGAL